MAKKIKKSKLDSLMSLTIRESRTDGKKAFSDIEETYGETDEPERPGWYPETHSDEEENTKKVKLFSKKSRKEQVPEVTPLQSGSIDIVDIISPSSADLLHRDYITVDGTYFAYLYISGYGYTTTVGNGWLNPLVEAGEGINLIFTINRQPKDKTLQKISNAMYDTDAILNVKPYKPAVIAVDMDIKRIDRAVENAKNHGYERIIIFALPEQIPLLKYRYGNAGNADIGRIRIEEVKENLDYDIKLYSPPLEPYFTKEGRCFDVTCLTVGRKTGEQG